MAEAADHGRIKLYVKLFPIILFFLILILAFFLRAQEVLFNNYLFLLDMGRDMLAVKEIVFEHNLTLIGPYTSLAGVFQGPFYYYLLALPTLFSNGDPIGPLILMVLISLATGLVAFYFLNKHFGKTVAFIGFFLFAISPEAVAAATYTWNPHPMWLLIILFIFLVYELHLKKDRIQIFLWPILGLMFHFEAALGFFLLAATFIYTVVHFKRKLFTRNFYIGISLLFLTFLPQILFDVRHDFLMTRSVIDMATGNNQSLTVKGEGRSIPWILQNHANTLIGNYLTTFPKIPLSPFLHLIVFVGSVAALFYTAKHKALKNYHIFYSFYFKFLLLFLILTSFYLFPLRYWFLTGFQSFYLIAATLTFSLFFRYKAGKIVLALLLLLIVPYLVSRLNVLYFNPPDDGGFAKVKGKLAAIEYIYADAAGKDFGLFVFTPPVYSDAYDYLVWWKAREKNRKIPHTEKQGTFYLLMEPDSSKPESHKGWLETVIVTGKVELTTTLPSGIIIQKRIQETTPSVSL